MHSYVNSCTNCSAVAGVPRRPGWLLALLLLLPCQQSAGAALPELYGKDYVRQGFSWDDGRAPAAQRAIHPSPDLDEAAYQQQIHQLELSEGPYADGLSEPLAGLAGYYRGTAQYGKAVGLYSRALHLVRINDGLYSERQIPLVRALLGSYRSSGDLEALDQRYDYFFRLLGNGEPPYTDIRVRASLEYLRWQREAFRIELDGSDVRRLLKMHELNEKILESATERAELSLHAYRRLVFSQLRNLYLLQGAIELHETQFGYNPRRALPSSQEPGLDLYAQRLAGIRRSSSATGRDLLQELIKRVQEGVETSAVEVAGFYLELGDWQQWNGNYTEARLAYSSVVELLEREGESALAKKWLGAATELPANGAYWQQTHPEETSRTVLLSARYDVSSRGRARNIQVSAATSEDAVFASRLRKKLAATRFRPRFAGGMAQEVQQMSRQYELQVD